MAIVIEGYCVVAKYEAIKELLEDGSVTAPNSREVTDKEIWRCGFMTEADANKFCNKLEEQGLNTSKGLNTDVVITNEFNRSIEPYCEWLELGDWDKAVIAWKAGAKPTTVFAHEGWDPSKGSGLEFYDTERQDDLKFLREEDNVEVYLNKKTGEEVYIGRTSPSLDRMFTSATEVVGKYFVTAGEKILTGDPAKQVRDAAEILEKLIEENPDWWNAQWYYGKSQIALGNYEGAYAAFQNAYRVEKETEAILRELGGVCLELGKFEEAVSVAEKALVLEADSPELLGNLALCFLLAARLVDSRKAIDFALKISPGDTVNHTVEKILSEIESGDRPQPTSLKEVMTPLPKKEVSFLKRILNFFS